MANKIWAVVQLREGGLHPLSLEALTEAQKLAEMGAGEVEAIVLGSDVGSAATELASYELACVRTISDPVLADYTPGAFVSALVSAIETGNPSIVVFPHSYQSVDFVPRLAQQTGAALVPEVTAVRRDGDDWIWTRPAFAGKLVSEVKARKSDIIFVTLQAGAFQADEVKTGSAPIEAIELSSAPVSDREILGIEEVQGERVDLSQAEAIVAVGRGIGEAEKLDIVRELASALGAELGASRPVIDGGWLDRDRQIGSSGQVVSPKLYIAVGISGAIQHLVGMKSSQTVVAINKDANAPIFGVADYGVVGDLFEVVPALTAAITEAKG